MIALVTGAGGFIGGHLVGRLLEMGYDEVRAIDVKSSFDKWWQVHAGARHHIGDLRFPKELHDVMIGVDEVYALAADMGGMGFISFNNTQILHNNLRINLNTLERARQCGVKKYFFASSVCVYPEELLERGAVLFEDLAIPAEPMEAYGWEKLVTELLCMCYRADHGMDTKIARFHNTYGPWGEWSGGREKAPAALCRKVAAAKASGTDVVEIWGTGLQERTFTYVDDTISGIIELMKSDYGGPFNIGADKPVVSINALAFMIAHIADVKIELVHDPHGPVGALRRIESAALAKNLLGWEAQTSLSKGLEITYQWVEKQVSECKGQYGYEPGCYTISRIA